MVFSLSIEEWKGIKTNLNEVSKLMLRISYKMFLNTNYINGDLKSNANQDQSLNSINLVISEFRRVYTNLFKEEQFL